MVTIPDLIDSIKDKVSHKWKITMDVPYSWIEQIGSRMNVFAWHKRWGNKQKGTGYEKRDEKRDEKYEK